MRPANLEQIGEELAIKWDNGEETFIALRELRLRCPCASCQGETDIMGNVYQSPKTPLPPSAFQLRGLRSVGSYAIQPTWGDGHGTGIFSFDYLRRLAPKS